MGICPSRSTGDPSDIPITLFVVRWHKAVSDRLGNSLIASIFMLYIPIMISGFILQAGFSCPVFTRGTLVALLWLAVAPFLISDALRFINRFFLDHRDMIQDPDVWNNRRLDELRRVQELLSRVVYDILGGDLLHTIDELHIHDNFGKQQISVEFPPPILSTAA